MKSVQCSPKKQRKRLSEHNVEFIKKKPEIFPTIYTKAVDMETFLDDKITNNAHTISGGTITRKPSNFNEPRVQSQLEIHREMNEVQTPNFREKGANRVSGSCLGLYRNSEFSPPTPTL